VREAARENVMSRGPDIATVTSIVAEVADRLILPRFRHLAADEIERKSTASDLDDLVTVVDREVEAELTSALSSLDPHAAVVGEEAVHRDPSLLGALESDDPVWLVDPIDGTRFFATGDDGFGVMIAFVVGGEACAAWVMLPARGEMYVAERGGGSWFNATRVHVPPTETSAAPRGSLSSRYMPPAARDMVEAGMKDRVIPISSGCAAVEYTDIVRGDRDFTIYYRLLPWDHAAPALVLEEAGGRVVHASGEPYRVGSADQVTVVVRDAALADRFRGWWAGRTY
jgi:fructose-1,6-bisphosphatase/inositol monophosphatase family enzyme